MKNFNYYQPTDIHFGVGTINEIGNIVKPYGTRCLLVTDSTPALKPLYDKVADLLAKAGIEVAQFDGVTPNPTLNSVTEGTAIAKQHQADVVLGVGGGSNIDTAKAIAVQATHPGTAFDYLFFSEQQPTEQTLPIIAVSTTSGTGSQVTKVAVITDTTKQCKSALCHPNIFPVACVVDPELMVTLPKNLTASTGWDVFTHAFESYININNNPYVDSLALEAIRLVANNLPQTLADGTNLKYRAALAWADTLAGMCIANVGTTAPHAMGQPISGHCPHITHGQSLAAIYPEFTRFTYQGAIDRFAIVGRIFNPKLENEPDDIAAEQACVAIDEFLQNIGMWFTLDDLKVPESEIPGIIEHCMEFPDYKGNPVVPTKEDIAEMYRKARTH